eukprot:CAMPEP_0197515512 /NCGR_PEP_ID=MMETSP1318-20131121/630_1 /TAXON_ID=552666 /ORGANISM="Partenskyella glossopodia, Strain RCC365" /LENGTH=486 /DNA_ID=CAMNT_0043063909 /DNA_START=197 /DNA_END=1657 /DNA_ORIENTATION=+
MRPGFGDFSRGIHVSDGGVRFGSFGYVGTRLGSVRGGTGTRSLKIRQSATDGEGGVCGPCADKAKVAVEKGQSTQEELSSIADGLSKAKASAGSVVAELLQRNDAASELLKEVEIEIEQTLSCFKSQGEVDPAVESQVEELYKMRATLQEELLPISRQIEELKQSSAATLALNPDNTNINQQTDESSSLSVDSTSAKGSGSWEKWFPVEFASKVTVNNLKAVEMFGRPWVIFRKEDGKVGCIHDQCAHRACPLSLGKVTQNTVECPYHGWRFNAQGNCEAMPSTRILKGIGVDSLPISEAGGMLWVWGGQSEPNPNSPPLPKDMIVPSGHEVRAEIATEVAIDHNDIAAVLPSLTRPFQDLKSIEQELSMPEQLSFHASRLLGGDLTPLAGRDVVVPNQSDMIVSSLRLGQSIGEMAELLTAVPAKLGYTRILYRMSLDKISLGAAAYLPLPWSKVLRIGLEQKIKEVEQAQGISREFQLGDKPMS